MQVIDDQQGHKEACTMHIIHVVDCPLRTSKLQFFRLSPRNPKSWKMIIAKKIIFSQRCAVRTCTMKGISIAPCQLAALQGPHSRKVSKHLLHISQFHEDLGLERSKAPDIPEKTLLASELSSYEGPLVGAAGRVQVHLQRRQPQENPTWRSTCP